MKPCPHCGKTLPTRPHRCSTDSKGNATRGCDWRVCNGCEAVIGRWTHHHPGHDRTPAECPTGLWPGRKVVS